MSKPKEIDIELIQDELEDCRSRIEYLEAVLQEIVGMTQDEFDEADVLEIRIMAMSSLDKWRN